MYTKYVDSMLELERPAVANDHSGKPQTMATRFIRGPGWCPARRHMEACEIALSWGADLICIVGADQIYPQDMLPRLIERWNQGYEVIAAMVPTRGYMPHMQMKPFQPMAWRIPNSEDGATKIKVCHDVEKLVDPIDPTEGDVQRVNFIGSGVLMFHRDHLLALKKPWFYETIDPDTFGRLACMDTKFVWRLQMEAGAKIWADTTIKVKHIHDMEIDETFQDRFEDWAEDGNGDRAICNAHIPAGAS